VHPVTLPVVELAVTTHVGERDDIDVTYGERARGGGAGPGGLPGWARDTADPAAWRTETGGFLV
jgi:hypothetical protein